MIINSVHDREFELRNDYAQKKSLQETTQWVETFSEEVFAFLFVCLFIWSPSKKKYS